MTVLLVVAGAALGAPLRYLVTHVLHRRDPALPWGTLAVNVAGSLLLGVLAGIAGRHLLVFAGIGFCGALTTYSAFGYDSVRLSRERGPGVSAIYVGLQIGCGVAAASLGLAIAAALRA